MLKRHRLEIAFLIAGSAMGFFLFHPYTMLIYSFMNVPVPGDDTASFQWKELFSIVGMTFTPMMLPMAIAFVLFNGTIGLLIGILIGKKRKLEQEKIALETLNRLVVTLSHYLLNANTVIGGMARHCKRAVANNDIMNSLEVIEEQARKIDGVINSLKTLTVVRTADYTTEGKALMIDISRELESLSNNPQQREGKSL